MSTKTERIEQDISTLEDFIGWLSAYVWEVEACGRDGALEAEKIKTLAPTVIKILAHYL